MLASVSTHLWHSEEAFVHNSAGPAAQLRDQGSHSHCCCRVEVLIQCDAGTYEMQSGTGDFAKEEPGCQSSHCELLHQPILATINVVS